MPLAVTYEDQLFRPIVLCDYCAKEIKSADDGNYQWIWTDDGPDRLYFTHKACCHAFEQRHGGMWCAMGLDLLPAYLVNNLGIDWEESQRMADFFSEL